MEHGIPVGLVISDPQAPGVVVLQDAVMHNEVRAAHDCAELSLPHLGCTSLLLALPLLRPHTGGASLQGHPDVLQHRGAQRPAAAP